MSRIMYRALSLTMVLAGTLLLFIGLDAAYDGMIARDAAMLAFMLGLVTAPGFLLAIGGVVVWLDTEPAPAEPADDHTDDWHCWCDGCRRYRTGTLRTDK